MEDACAGGPIHRAGACRGSRTYALPYPAQPPPSCRRIGIHSRYARRVSDLPCSGRLVRLHIDPSATARRTRGPRVQSEARRICDRHVLHLIKSVQASGPGSPASARDQPVLRRSPPIKPSRNNPANAAVRSCRYSGLMRVFTARSDEAQRSSIPSIDARAIHAPESWKLMDPGMDKGRDFNVRCSYLHAY